VAREISAGSCRFLDPGQQLLMVLNRFHNISRLEPALGHVAFVLGAVRNGRLRQLGFPLLGAHLEKPAAEAGREAQNHAGIVDIFVDQLVIEPHLGAQLKVPRHQRRLGKSLVEVVEDHRRFHDRIAVMHQGGHDGVRVELHVGGVELVARQGHQMLLGLEPFLMERNAHLLGADGVDAVVKLKHFYLPE
jgi:hypothetical protein